MKKLLITISVILFIFLLILGIIKYKDYKNSKEIANSIHGIVISDYAPLYSRPKTENVMQIKSLKKSDKVYILEQFNQDGIDWYKVKVDGNKNGYVRADTVGYYQKEKYNKFLVADVSQFNIHKAFENPEMFATFLVEDNISGVYIRAGGNHYINDDLQFYEDSAWQIYVNECEYLGIPYGFYFVDESRDVSKVVEEKDYIKNFLNNHKGSNCVLPVSIDIEVAGDEDENEELWKIRNSYIQELNNQLTSENIKSIYYVNARLACLYIDSVEVDYWVAMWPDDNVMPNTIADMEPNELHENRAVKENIVAWQFTSHRFKISN